jgi:hypothetical protein
MNVALALIIAQGLAEYGGTSGALAQTFEDLRLKINQVLGNTGPGTWVLGGGALVLLWFFLRGRR